MDSMRSAIVARVQRGGPLVSRLSARAGDRAHALGSRARGSNAELMGRIEGRGADVQAKVSAEKAVTVDMAWQQIKPGMRRHYPGGQGGGREGRGGGKGVVDIELVMGRPMHPTDHD